LTHPNIYILISFANNGIFDLSDRFTCPVNLVNHSVRGSGTGNVWKLN